MFSGLTLKIIAGAVALGAVLFIIHKIRESGADSVRAAIERQNNEAGKAADASVLDYDACRDAGRVWDFGAGRCVGPAPGRRN
ncbi:hypothetical protein TAL182_CH01150 [Rhizobium sp. TAL182]|uniref:hypothetical protein n=1 Tax=Rhizobium sp. TAL182 TaxID=2020313 RepID=UPI000A20FAE3|nr:hypothetical protein [Rhizobium sp. TAL182]ARO22963.1 hypothetical protein TAL182_CH01150 [Rhizobium sp. TAL182]